MHKCYKLFQFSNSVLCVNYLKFKIDKFCVWIKAFERLKIFFAYLINLNVKVGILNGYWLKTYRVFSFKKSPQKRLYAFNQYPLISLPFRGFNCEAIRLFWDYKVIVFLPIIIIGNIFGNWYDKKKKQLHISDTCHYVAFLEGVGGCELGNRSAEDDVIDYLGVDAKAPGQSLWRLERFSVDISYLQTKLIIQTR